MKLNKIPELKIKDTNFIISIFNIHILFNRTHRCGLMSRLVLGLFALSSGLLDTLLVVRAAAFTVLIVALGLLRPRAVDVVEPVTAALDVVPSCACRTLVLLGYSVITPPIDVTKVLVAVEAVFFVVAVVLTCARNYYK